MNIGLRVGLLASVLVGCASLPRPGKPTMADTQFRMREFKLANGLRLIVEEDHASPLVGVFTVVGVGSSGDPEGRAGLAHLMEHLAFRARPGGKMTAWNQLEGAGVGFLNAFTSFDETVYMEVASKDLLPQLLNIEMGRMLDPLNGVDAKTFEVEREVVRNELRQRGENANGPAFNFLQEAAFPASHPYSRPVGGSHQSLDAITFDDAKKFALTHYRPDNMTMLVIGDVDLETFDQAFKKALPSPVFAPRPVKDPSPNKLAATPPEPPEPPAAPPERFVVRKSAVASPELYVVWTLPRSFDAETVLLDFVATAAERELSDAFISDPDIVNVGVFPVAGAQASMLVAVATLRDGSHPDRSLERVLDQLVKIWASGEAGRVYSGDSAETVVETERDFGRRRNGALVQMTLDAEAIMRRGAERVVAAHFTGDPLTYSRRLRALAAITPSQVTHFAEKYLQRSRARAVLVKPFDATDKESGAASTGLASASREDVVGLSAEKVNALGRGHLERSKMETVVSASRDHADETLPNGLRVVIRKRRNSLPVASLKLVFTRGSGGTAPLGAGDYGDMLASPREHRYGTGGDFGIGWGRDVAVDRSTLFASGASGNVPNMLAQLSDRVHSLRVESSSLAFFKTEFLDSVAANEKRAAARADRALNAALFEGHPWGTRSTVDDARKLSAGDIEGWFDHAWSPQNAVLVVAGDVNVDATLATVKDFLGTWSASAAPFPAVSSPSIPTRAPKVVVTHQPNATQAQVHFACLSEGKTLPRTLTQHTVAGLVATALFERIRGELGASYGFNGGVTPLLGGVHRLDWGGAIENGRLPQALAVLGDTLLHFEGKTLTPAALERARWGVARESTLVGATADTVTDVLAEEALAGRDTTEFDAKRFEMLSAIDRAQVLEIWNQCAGNLVISIVGDETRVNEALKSSGF